MFLYTCIKLSYVLGALAIAQMKQLDIAKITDVYAAFQCMV